MQNNFARIKKIGQARQLYDQVLIKASLSHTTNSHPAELLAAG